MNQEKKKKLSKEKENEMSERDKMVAIKRDLVDGTGVEG